MYYYKKEDAVLQVMREFKQTLRLPEVNTPKNDTVRMLGNELLP